MPDIQYYKFNSTLMKKNVSFLAVMVLAVGVILPPQAGAQAPDKMSYQAVIRDAENQLVTDQPVGMQVSILQGSVNGTAVYVETHASLTNANGLVSIEIGAGTLVSGDFTTLDWAGGPYFIKTETDPEGGTNYTITGVSQLLSVPYALHANTAGAVSESDPVYRSSVAGGINTADIALWNSKLDAESDPLFSAWDKKTGIEITQSQISDLDPFTTADETDPEFVAWDKSSGISIHASQIEASNQPSDSTFLRGDGIWVPVSGSGEGGPESDPVYSASVASGITANDTALWNSKLDGESDPLFSAWDKKTGIEITQSQISDLDLFTTADETDPVYGESVASGITADDTALWNSKLATYTETDPEFMAWDKSSGISIHASQIEASNQPSDSTFLRGDGIWVTVSGGGEGGPESDPVYSASVAGGITTADTALWNSKLDGESDPLFSAWDKKTGIEITQSQISDLDPFTNADETDPVYGESIASGITADDTALWNSKLATYTETDPMYSASVASGITANDTALWNSKSESITETDPVFSEWVENGSVAPGDSIVLKDESGNTRIVLNPNTGTFKMMDNDTVWYQIRVQSNPEEKTVHNDGSYTVKDGNTTETHAPDGRLVSTRIEEESTGDFIAIKYNENGTRSELEAKITRDDGVTEIGQNKFDEEGHPTEEHITIIDNDPNGNIVHEDKIFNEDGLKVEEVREERTKTGQLVSKIVKKNGKIVSEEHYYPKTAQYPVASRISSWNSEEITGQTWTQDQSYSADGYSETYQQGNEPPFGWQYEFSGSLSSTTASTDQLIATGNFSATGSKQFRIDHPLDPSKYLQHASLESNEVLNYYSGNVVTGNTGKAVVQLPAYFEAINTDYRYQLTVIGTFAQAIVSKKIQNNQFEIHTSEPNVEVSWQVTARRNDAYMQEHPFREEPEK
jgi:hypothetical protein